MKKVIIFSFVVLFAASAFFVMSDTACAKEYSKTPFQSMYDDVSSWTDTLEADSPRQPMEKGDGGKKHKRFYKLGQRRPGEVM